MQELMQRLAQEAHDAGAKSGGWARKWEHMGESQRKDWEAVALAVAQAVARECLQDDAALAELMAEHLYGHSRSDAIEWAKEDKFDSEKEKALALIAIMRAAISARFGLEG